jgi:predicted DNA-binding antitoxin AbrB/MazE fold protein
MTVTVEAIYEQGVLRPLERLPVADGARVEITVKDPGAAPSEVPSLATEDAATSARRLAQRLAEIAAMPPEGDTAPFSGVDHDKVLYGERGAW